MWESAGFASQNFDYSKTKECILTGKTDLEWKFKDEKTDFHINLKIKISRECSRF